MFADVTAPVHAQTMSLVPSCAGHVSIAHHQYLVATLILFTMSIARRKRLSKTAAGRSIGNLAAFSQPHARDAFSGLR